MNKVNKDRRDFPWGLTAEMLRVGDIVKLKDEVFKMEVMKQSRSIYNENLFTVKRINKDNVQLGQIDGVSFKYDAIEAVLIGSQEDAAIYYVPMIAADVVKVDAPLPEHITYFRNYLWHFKDVNNSKGESYYDLIYSKGLRFVHEVQHWMQDEEKEQGLQIDYSLSAHTGHEIISEQR